MQGHFRRTVQPHSNNARPRTNRSVAAHFVILPSARSHSPWQDRLQLYRDGTRQTKLASVCMAAQHQIEISVGSLAENFRCMRQQDRETVLRDLRSRLFDV